MTTKNVGIDIDKKKILLEFNTIVADINWLWWITQRSEIKLIHAIIPDYVRFGHT